MSYIETVASRRLDLRPSNFEFVSSFELGLL